MQIITYSLRTDGTRSDKYFQDVASFTDTVLATGEGLVRLYLDAFWSFIQETHREALRSRAEYLYELLTLGVLWQVYGDDALGLADVPRQALTQLAQWRERDDKLKPIVDGLRGILGTLFLSSRDRHSISAPPLTLAHLDKFLGWLAATRILDEEARRLAHWRDFLVRQTPDEASAVLDAILAFAAWFETRSAEALGRYTPNVERFLSRHHSSYRWREDALFCGRKRVEYHLNMVGTEVLNRAFRESFLRTSRKIVLVPPCMRFQPEGRCKAHPSALGAQCAHCTPLCHVHQVTKLGDKYGFAVFMLPDELAVFSAPTASPGGSADMGIVGVSCVLTNAAGGWKAHRLGIPAQGIPLDYCGCRWHWHKEGIATDVNLHHLLSVLGVYKYS